MSKLAITATTEEMMAIHANRQKQFQFTVVVPAGTVVKSCNPQKRQYTLKRAQKVLVNHTLFAHYTSVQDALNNWTDVLERNGFDLSQLTEWQRLNSPEFYRMRVQVQPEMVRWAGSGGYWCEAPRNQCFEE